jgi:hypothetical protein
MYEAMVMAVQGPGVPWAVLGVAAVAVVIEALRINRQALWDDFFAEALD